MYLAEEGGLDTRELKLAEEDNGRGSTDSHGGQYNGPWLLCRSRLQVSFCIASVSKLHGANTRV